MKHGKHRIVLVEDDDSIRLIAQLTLEMLGGHEIHAFASGAEALARAPALAPHLLVLDVSMPGMDGPQTLQAMRRTVELANIPAVFLTANTQANQVASYLALGAVDVIAKPFDPSHLKARIDAALSSGARNAPANDTPHRVALVVEDDPGIRYLLRFILEQNGWSVREAVDGPQGLQAIMRGAVPDVVLLDIMLPGIDGLALLDRLKAQPRWAQVPVLMLSANGDEPSVQRALAAGAADYIGKPFEPVDLLARLARHASRHG